MTSRTHMSECPHCGLALSPRAMPLPSWHCPRCLTRHRRRVELRPLATTMRRRAAELASAPRAGDQPAAA